jgi:two-component system CheB/CheR fusion protein
MARVLSGKMRVQQGQNTATIAGAPRSESAIRQYAIALLIVGLALLIRWPLYPWLGASRPYLTLFGGVTLAVWLARWRAATVAAIAGLLIANYFLSEPKFAFHFNTFFVSEIIGYAFSAGAIIFFGETMRRAREREIEQKNLASVTLASIGDAVIATATDATITFLNPEAERLTGWKSAEASGRAISEVFRIVNEKTGRPAEDPTARVLRTGKVVGLANHTLLISKDGRRTPIDDSAAPIRYADGSLSGVVLVFRDVTTQRKAHEAREQLAAVIEFSGDAIFTKNLEGTIQSWNASAERVFGYRAEEIIGKPVTALFPPERVGEEERIIGLLRQGQPCEHLETVRLTKDGRQIPVLISVSPLKDAEQEVIGASAIVHDVTEMVAAREALVREKELLATTLASIGDGVIVTGPNGRVTFLNAEAERLTGWKTSEATGRTLPEIFHIVNEETRQVVENPVEKVLRLGTVVGLANHTVLIAKDGREIPIDDSGAPIRGSDGTMFGVVLVFRDFTERKQATDVLQQAKRQAEEANRAKDHFLAMLSHELRTPLTPVLMTATALEADSSLRSDVRDQLAMMRRNIELEAKLIDDLLDVSRIAHGKFQLRDGVVDLHAAIEHALGISASELNAKKLKVSKSLHAAEHFCRGDAARLHEVFWNILKNAVKFTPEDGRIDIVTRNDDRRRIRIEFRDTGIGIEPEMQARIFDVFEQGGQPIRARYGGLGLGLAISKRIVDLHNGTICVESTGRDRGSVFTIVLDVLDSSVLQTPAPRRTHGITRRGVAPKILVVEDHKDTSTVLRRILESAGCTVSRCATIAEAKRLAAEHEFDLVICDIGLPDGSGLDLMRHFGEAHALTGIALSGFGTQEDVAASRQAGFAVHLTKPVDLEVLRATVAELLQTKQMAEA